LNVTADKPIQAINQSSEQPTTTTATTAISTYNYTALLEGEHNPTIYVQMHVFDMLRSHCSSEN
jgi:hypothetical protein